MMSNIVILFADKNSSYLLEKAFDGKSAFDMSLRWAGKQNSKKVIVFATPENEEKLRNAENEFAKNHCLPECDSNDSGMVGGDFSVDFAIRSDWTIHNLMAEIKNSCEKHNADYAVYAWADCPFLNVPLTSEIVETHKEFSAEYTFAEGFPYGFAPEVIDAGVAGILAALSESTQKEIGCKPVTRSSIFDLLKTDINSFEVETVLSDEDWRLFRFSFDAGTKSNLIACKSLYEIVTGETSDAADSDISYIGAEKLSEIAATKKEIIKTLPSFYNIQISDRISGNPIYLPAFCHSASEPSDCHYAQPNRDFIQSAPHFESANCHSEKPDCHSERSRGIPETPPVTNQSGSPSGEIDFEKLCILIEEIADFSENAVINLSYFGEPFRNQKLPKIIGKILSYPGLSVFIETDGLFVTDNIMEEIKSISDNASPRKNGYDKIMFAVSLDAMTGETFEKVRGIPKSEFQKAVASVSVLAKYFPENVYPQFIRMNENEEELEGFYRFWSAKGNPQNPPSPSNGNLIIQKYNSFCGELPERKPADLSPLERNVCWHLRRDISILMNGDVCFCHSDPKNIIGNVFNESNETGESGSDAEIRKTGNLERIWTRTDFEVQNQIEKFCKKSKDAKFCEKCGKCDEYYTFNF